jgi:hypothetical protein
MEVLFQKRRLKLVVTDHARQRMVLRSITVETLVDALESGATIKKKEANKFWVYKSVPGRNDNTICFSIAIEDPNLVVLTALVNWRPH